MKGFIAIFLLALLPACTALNCYACTSTISPDCGDPFNPLGSGVTIVSSDSGYCEVAMIAGVYERLSVSSCTPSPVMDGTGITCCQTDLCNGESMNNGAHGSYEKSIPLTLSFAVTLAAVRLFWKA